jgi:hypothetical protein
MKFNIALLLALFIFGNGIILAQHTVVGSVFDEETKEPLEGVSVFYDGTSIGTITDEKGTFTLISGKPISASLVISFIGYTSQLFENASGGLGTIFLKENAVQLNEIVLKPDTWSREKKLNIFRREFLGASTAGLNCKIKNEDDIRLYYNKEKNSLYAYAEVPIMIENKYLDYLIRYNLYDFEVNFGIRNTDLFNPRSSYTAGTLFFSELHPKKTKKRYLKRRRESFLGSPVHFMRSLSEKKLQEEKFKIFKGSFEVDPYSEFRVTYTDEITTVIQRTKKLAILYDGSEQSSIDLKQPTFYIDAYGNHNPIRDVLFSGVFGAQRVGDLVPLDYVVEGK